jgi:hypothetical protein
MHATEWPAARLDLDPPRYDRPGGTGAKPAGLPVEQPFKFERVLNLEAAKALGVTIPPAIRVRADRIVE